MVNDTISDLLTRIRNANLIKTPTVCIPLTRINKQITEILEKQGFIESFQIFPTSSVNKNNSEYTESFEKPSVDIDNSKKKKIAKKKLSGKQRNQNLSDMKNNKQINTKYKGNTSYQEILVYLKYKGLEKKPCITNLKRISKPGLRIYTSYNNIPKILGGMGIAILSTSKGIMTDREARFYKVGGEILCSIW